MYKDADLFDFINAPVGKGLPITEALRPLIAGASFPMEAVLLSHPGSHSTNNCGNWVRDDRDCHPGHYVDVLQDRYRKPRDETYAWYCRHYQHPVMFKGAAHQCWFGRTLPQPGELHRNPVRSICAFSSATMLIYVMQLHRTHTSPKQPKAPSCVPRQQPCCGHLLHVGATDYGEMSAEDIKRPERL